MKLILLLHAMQPTWMYLFLLCPIVSTAVPPACPDSGFCSCSKQTRWEMKCTYMTELPSLPNSTYAGDSEVVKALLLTKGGNITTLYDYQLYTNNLFNLQEIDLTFCKIKQINGKSFYQMSLLQHLNLR